MSDQSLLSQFEPFQEFSRIFIDAYVLINREGKIIKFNQYFPFLFNLKPIDIKRAGSLDKLLQLHMPNNDENVLETLFKSPAPIRLDEIVGQRVNIAEPLNLILGAYPFFLDGSCIGLCLLLRDVTAESALQGKYKERTLQSITDTLTGLYVRRYFEDWLNKEVAKAKGQGQICSVGVLMFDLDKFKSINDGFGHQAGDFVLSNTSKILQSNSRSNDILGRYGGEELVAFLVGASPRGSVSAAEKFRTAIKNHCFEFEGKVIPVSSSVGVSFFQSTEDTAASVLARADKCLYEAKKNGRNRVYVDVGQGPQSAEEYLAINAKQDEDISPE